MSIEIEYDDTIKIFIIFYLLKLSKLSNYLDLYYPLTFHYIQISLNTGDFMKYKPPSVLLVEDDPQHAESIKAMLERVHEFDFVLKHCYKLQEGLKILKNDEFDVILLDLGLPDSAGFETFQSIHQQATKIPIVIFTSLFDEEIALKTLRSGAQEYLFKGEYDGQDLVTAINHSIARMKFVASND